MEKTLGLVFQAIETLLRIVNSLLNCGLLLSERAEKALADK